MIRTTSTKQEIKTKGKKKEKKKNHSPLPLTDMTRTQPPRLRNVTDVFSTLDYTRQQYIQYDLV
jgi:hypothetical protein